MSTETISLELVRRALAMLATNADDPEMAHWEEDDLWMRTLQAIAEGHPDSTELAKLALQTRDLGFPRWYA